MKKLGISVYPQHAPIEEVISYIQLAGGLGYKRIFTCLISADEESIKDFKLMCNAAKQCGMEIISDVNPEVIKKFDIHFTDLKFFYDLGLSGIRMDMGYSGFEESVMTYNPYNLKIELNISMGNKYIDNIVSYKPNINNLYACHNFYPRKDTGLDLDFFNTETKKTKKYHVNTAAFIDSKNASIGPWPVSTGLCTLEHHRNLPLIVQAKELIINNDIDDIIIANMFASKKELEDLANLNKDMLELNIHLNPDLSEIERKLILEEIHFNRGDFSNHVIRSTEPRVTKYKNIDILPKHCVDIKKGDVTIDNNIYSRYCGELQIALQDMKNDGNVNVVGHIDENEIYLTQYIKSWNRFKFKEFINED